MFVCVDVPTSVCVCGGGGEGGGGGAVVVMRCWPFDTPLLCASE